MREKDYNNIPQNNNEENEFAIPMESACSAEFPSGCIFCNEE